MLTAVIYVLLAIGVALVAIGAFDVVRQILKHDTGPRSAAPYLSALVIVVGIGSLGTSGFLSLKKPTTPQAAPSPATTPATASTIPGVTPGPATSAPAIGAGDVTIDPPAAGTKVEQCNVFTGQANLPQGETVVLGVRNLSDTGNTTYLAPVNNWNNPSALTNWTDIQYFGSGDSSVGQTYLVSVIVMASDTVKTALAEPANRSAWAVTALPGGSSIKSTLKLVRVTGPGPQACR